MSGETYVKRYPGGFIDLPSQTTKVDANFLNAVEAALLRLLGEDPADGEVGVWNAALARFVFQLLTNAQIAPAAGITRSKLDFGGGLVDADIAAGAQIAQSKIAGSIFSPAIVDAKGDLLVGQVDNVLARLPVGADNSLVVADSAQTLGLKYMTVAQLQALLLPLQVTVGTTLPGSPTDQQEAILVDSLTTPTYAWRFKYIAGISDANKWVYIGGSPVLVEVATAETAASTTYVALTTAGPSFTVPRAGNYFVEHGFENDDQTGQILFMSYDIGAALGACTISIATPAVITLASHGLAVGDQVAFTTTGALPTGLAINTPYYVIAAGFSAGSFQVSTSPGGGAVNTSGTQSGTQTLWKGMNAQDADAVRGGTASGSQYIAAGGRSRLKSGLVASTPLTAKYRSNVATARTFQKRWLKVTPQRVA